MANGLIPDLPDPLTQAQFDVEAGPNLRAMVPQPSGRERFGNALARFGAAFDNPFGTLQQVQRTKMVKHAALEAALERLPEGDIRRDQLAAQFDELVGVQGAGAAIKPGPQVLSAGQSIVQQTAGGEFEQKVAPTFAPLKPSETQRGIAELLARGFNLADSQDIQRGRVVPTTPDAFGNVHLINRATGETRLVVRGGDTAQPAAEVEAGEGRQLPGLGPIEAVKLGVGPAAKAKQALSDFVGSFVAGTLFEDTQKARQRLGLFNKVLERMLVNNPRFPLGEMEIVRELKPDTAAFFTDPDAARVKLIETRDFIDNSIRIKETEMRAPGITSKRRAELAGQISVLRESRALFGPVQVDDVSQVPVEVLIDVDPTTLSPDQLRIMKKRLEQALQ